MTITARPPRPAPHVKENTQMAGHQMTSIDRVSLHAAARRLFSATGRAGWMMASARKLVLQSAGQVCPDRVSAEDM